MATTATVSKEQLLAHLVKVEDYYKQFAGKLGYNPFKFIAEKVQPLRAKLNTTDTTPELTTAILSLEMKEENAIVLKANVGKDAKPQPKAPEIIPPPTQNNLG